MPKRIRLYTLAALLALLCVGLWAVWAYGTCAFHSGSYADAHLCYVAREKIIMHDLGPREALAYAHYVVSPNHGYELSHSVLHYVGDATYAQTQKLSVLAMYMEPYASSISKEQFYNGFDGFPHGFISSYVVDQHEPVEQTMQRICGGSTTIPGITNNEFACYHTLGHAIMHAHGNSLTLSVALCAKAPTDDARYGCYYGAFMEDSFLYNPDYHLGSPRPDATSTSMAEVCPRFAGIKLRLCDAFVGSSISNANNYDITVGFNECQRLSDPTSCIRRMGEVYIASLSHTPDEPSTLCRHYTEERYVHICTEGAAVGLQEGLGVHSFSLLEKIDNFAHGLYVSIRIVSRL